MPHLQVNWDSDMYPRGAKVVGFGDGPFQTLNMSVRWRSEVARLLPDRGVELLLRSDHQDGGGRECSILIDVESHETLN